MKRISLLSLFVAGALSLPVGMAGNVVQANDDGETSLKQQYLAYKDGFLNGDLVNYYSVKITLPGDTQTTKFWVRKGFELSAEENPRYDGTGVKYTLNVKQTDPNADITNPKIIGDVLTKTEVEQKTIAPENIHGETLSGSSMSIFGGASNSTTVTISKKGDFMINASGDGKTFINGQDNFVKVEKNNKKGGYYFTVGNQTIEVAEKDLYVVGGDLGVFTTQKGGTEVYDGPVYGSHNEILKTTRGDAGSYYSFWGSEITSPNMALNLTQGEFIQFHDELVANDQKLYSSDVKNMAIDSDSHTIGLMTNEQLDENGNVKAGTSVAIPGAVKVESTGGENGKDVSIKFSNDANTTGFSVDAGSKVSGDNKDALTELTINGETYKIQAATDTNTVITGGTVTTGDDGHKKMTLTTNDNTTISDIDLGEDKDTTYTAGDNVTIDKDNKISVTNTTLDTTNSTSTDIKSDDGKTTYGKDYTVVDTAGNKVEIKDVASASTLKSVDTKVNQNTTDIANLKTSDGLSVKYDNDTKTSLTLGEKNTDGTLKNAYAVTKDADGNITGSTGGTKITNVAYSDGTNGSDAVNVDYLKEHAADRDLSNLTTTGETKITNLAKGADQHIAAKEDYAVDADGKVTLTYVDGNGKEIAGQKAVITGIAKNDLSNITDGGKTVIKDLAKNTVKFGTGNYTTISSTKNTTDGSITYKVDVTVDGKVEDGNTGIVTGGTVNEAIQNATKDFSKTDYRLENGTDTIKEKTDTTTEVKGYKVGADGTISLTVQNGTDENSKETVIIGDVASKAQQDTNTKDIATNKTNIETNTKNINSLTGRVTTNEGNISKLQNSDAFSVKYDADKNDSTKQNYGSITLGEKNADGTVKNAYAVTKDADGNITGSTGGTKITNVAYSDGTGSDAVNVDYLKEHAADRDLSNLTTTGKTTITNLAKGAVKVINGTNTTVTEGTDGDAKTYQVNVEANGAIADKNTGIVTGGTVYNAIEDAKKLDKYVTGGSVNATTGEISLTIANGQAANISGLSDFVKGKDSYVTGAKLSGSTLTISRNQELGDLTVDLSSITSGLSSTDYRLINGKETIKEKTDTTAEVKGYKVGADGTISLTVQNGSDENSKETVTIGDVASKAQQDKNTAAIETNAKNISTNTQNIQTNKNNITALQNSDKLSVKYDTEDKSSLTLGGAKYNATDHTGGTKITNVAYSDGTGSDAVNVDYLNKAVADSEAKLTDKGLIFAGNTGTASKKLGETLTIKGEGTKGDDAYSGENVKTVVDTDGNLVIKLAKDLTGLSSVTTGSTKMESDGITITGQKNSSGTTDKDIVIKENNISMGDRVIHDVEAGNEDTDAVNKKQMDDAIANISGTEKGGFGLTAADGKTIKKGLGDTIDVVGANGIVTSVVNQKLQISLGSELTVGEKNETDAQGNVTKEGKDGQITIVNKDGAGTTLTLNPNGTHGVEGTDGTTTNRIEYTDENGKETVATLNDGLKFKGDGDKEITKKLNDTLQIAGGADASKLTDGNIGVVAGDDGMLHVKLSSDIDLGDAGTISIGGTSITKNKITIGGKHSLTLDGENGTISGLGNTTWDGDKITAGQAATEGQLKAVQDALKESIAKEDARGVKYDTKKDANGNDVVDYDRITMGGGQGTTYNYANIAAGKASGGTTITNVAYVENVTRGSDGYDGSAAVNVDRMNDSITDAIKNAKDDMTKADQHLVANPDGGNYKVDDNHQVTLKVQDGYESDGTTPKYKDVVIDNVAKADEVGDVSQLHSGLQNKDDQGNVKAGTTVVDAVNNLDTKVDSLGTKVGELDTRIDNVEKLAGKHSTVTVNGGTEQSGNLVLKETAATDAKGTNYDISLSNKITLGDANGKHVTVDGTEGKVTASDSITVGTDADASKNIVIGKTADGTNGITGLGNTEWKNDADSQKGYAGSGKAATESQLKQAMDGAVQYDRDASGKVSQTITLQEGTDKKGTVIKNVGDGTLSKDSTDAVNGKQLYEVQQEIQKNDQNIGAIAGSVSRLNGRVNQVGAGAAALAALQPLDFDPDAKWDFSAGYGNYNGANAVAIGTYYRPNEDVMLSIGGSMGGGENMVNAGISVKLGAGSSHVTSSKVAMAKEIKDLRQVVSAQSQQLAVQSQQIATQAQQIAELMALVKGQTAPAALAAPAAPKSDMFPDIPQNHWAYEAVKDLEARGLVEGYEDGTFGGDRTLTRYEFAQIVYRALQSGAANNASLKALQSEFAPELENFTLDTVAKDKNGNPTIVRVRAVKGK